MLGVSLEAGTDMAYGCSILKKQKAAILSSVNWAPGLYHHRTPVNISPLLVSPSAASKGCGVA